MRHALLCVVLFMSASYASFAEDGEFVTPPASDLKPDEVLLFFPGYAWLDSDQQRWRTNVHGNVHEPEQDSSKRALLIGMLQAATRATLKLDNNHFLDARVRPFLVDNEGGKSITVRIGNTRYELGESESNGHFEKQILLANDIPRPDRTGVIGSKTVHAVLPHTDERSFLGRVYLIPPKGLSVISDIDDTIKRSEVTNKTELIKNTFLREFREVDGMSDLYATLQRKNVAFHYVSGSVWQLYPPLSDFLADRGFPGGTFHLKYFRLKDGSAKQILSSQNAYKLDTIRPILSHFPERRFILIGDSGEQDPEIYGDLARQFPKKVVGIFVRNVTEESTHHQRFQEAFRDLPPEQWMLFDEANQIEKRLKSLVDAESQR